jgi:hypothetical protein
MLFYKYREITDPKNPHKNNSIHALINSYRVLSGRRNFDDPLDSKIKFVCPSPQQLSSLRPIATLAYSHIIDGLVSNGKYTRVGYSFLNNMQALLNEMIDSYPIYCVSSRCDNNLLWNLYGSSHKGFCIEFEIEGNEQPKKVMYQEKIASINLFDLIRYNFRLDDGNELGQRIHDALLVKLKKWAYQSEYRWIVPNSTGRVPKREMYIKNPYDPRKVKSIIFGYDMSPEVKEYVIKNIPFTTMFRQALRTEANIKIIDFDYRKHGLFLEHYGMKNAIK